jgi:methionyl-tRNA synthetase
MDELSLDVACQTAFRLVDATNEYIASSEPWALAKAGKDAALDQVLWTAAEATRVAAVLLSPVMPGSAEAILARLDAPSRRAGDLRWTADAVLQTSGSRHVTKGDALWPRFEAAGADAATTIQTRTKESAVTEQPKDVPPAAAAPVPASAPAAPPAPAAPQAEERLSIDEFMSVDLRVAKVLTAERVPNSKKLMKLSVDLGAETRTIVAGIAEAYEADALVGRSIVIVANLKPAKLMGIESNGMVLAATGDGGKPVLLGLEQPPAPGSKVR